VTVQQKFSDAQLDKASKALQEMGIAYKQQPDGTLLVPGKINLSKKGLKVLPDLSCVAVEGGFLCEGNQLTSLAGAPFSVGGGFFCGDNQLLSLEGCPAAVGGAFSCMNNRLTSLAGAPAHIDGTFYGGNNQLVSLAGAPKTVGDEFYCCRNQLTSLEGAPVSVGGAFYCEENQLTSLEHAPVSVGTYVRCDNNPLTSLEHAPQNFKHLLSDLGSFSSWDDVPEVLRISPETKAGQHKAFLDATNFSKGISKPMAAPKPIILKSRPAP
jgi:hypothetical protein